jgi:hypothetical protein
MTKIVGLVLVVAGIVGIGWGGFNYTTRETVVDLGPIHATRDQNHTVPLPPVAGAVALAAGVGLLVAGKKVG